MKFCAFIASFFVVIIFVFAESNYYDKKYDLFDVDFLIHNPRLMRNYMDCFLDHGPCTPIGNEFKRGLKEVVTSSCTKCTPSQKRLARKAFDAFKNNFPESFTELKSKLDPGNKFYPAFEKSVANA